MKNKILILLFFTIKLAFSQSHSIEFILRENKTKIELKKINSREDLSSPSYPFYLIKPKQYKLLENFSFVNKLQNTLFLEYLDKKTLAEDILTEYENISKNQEKRIQLYKKSYNDLLTINKNLDIELKKAIELAKKPKKINRGVLWGTIGVVTGTIIGILAN